MKISIRRTGGALELSAVTGGTLIRRQYVGYSTRQARALFHLTLQSQNP